MELEKHLAIPHDSAVMTLGLVLLLEIGIWGCFYFSLKTELQEHSVSC
jgi:hypothetical protein